MFDQVLPQRTVDRRGYPFTSIAVGLVATVVAYALWGRVFRWTFDEGIYLVNAERVLRGEIPFRDFFSITGPATYYLYAAALALFGHSYIVARLVLCLEIGVICACIHHLVRFLTGRGGWAVGASLFFLGLCAAVSFRMWVNHRWDSAAVLLLAITLLFAECPLCSGCVAALACLFTPSLVPVALLVGFGAGWSPLRRFLIGWGAVAFSALAALAYARAIPAVVDQIFGFMPACAAANAAWPVLESAGSRVLWVARLVILALPFLTVGLCMLARKGRRLYWALLVLGGLAAIYPRFTLDQLFFTTPIAVMISFTVLADRVKDPLANASLACFPL